MYHALATSPSIFVLTMITHYCHTIEEALRRAKKAGRMPGCYFGGIILKSGKRGFAVYRDGKVVEQYSVIGRPVAGPAEFGFQRQGSGSLSANANG